MVSADLPDTCKTPTRDLERRGRTCRDHQVFQRHPVRAARPSSKLTVVKTPERERARACPLRVGESAILGVLWLFSTLLVGESGTATQLQLQVQSGEGQGASGYCQARPGPVRSGRQGHRLQLADGTGGACRETSARLARLGSTQVSICTKSRSEQERARASMQNGGSDSTRKHARQTHASLTQAFRLSLVPAGGQGNRLLNSALGSQLPSCASHPKCCIAELRYGSVRRTRESWWRAGAAALSLQVTACGLATRSEPLLGLPTAWGTTASPGGTWFPGRRRRRVCGVQVRSAKCREHCIHRFHSLHSAPPPSAPRLRHALPRKATA
jgi:hypothetical protein